MIKVIIERKVIDGFEEYYDRLISKIITVALASPGYIDSEVMQSQDNPNHRIVATNWSSTYHWQQWQSSKKRHRIIDKIRPLLEEPERVLVMNC